MNVFTDFHHAGLLNSLIMLFEGRLGGKVYRPIGMDWYDEGYWKVYDHPATAAQYLQIGAATPDGTPKLNEVDGMQWEKGAYPFKDPYVYFCRDIDSWNFNNAITLDGFKNCEKFDILIASLPQHIEPFKKLISLYQPQAKLIYQVGNQWNIDAGSVKNVMASANVDIPKDVNGIIYHQEFSLDTFHYSPVPKEKKIYSFINCLNVVDIYKKDWELFLELEEMMPDWEFKSFGGQCRDGAIAGGKELADKMREAAFIFHCKTDGDGYGHVIHNAAAVGRPLITRANDYKGKLAEPLINHATSILVDNRTPEQVKRIIEYDYLRPSYMVVMSGSIKDEFNATVNFDAEEQMIRKFLDNLL